MKKTFLGVILSCLMAVCLCVGVTFIKVKTTIASANATFTETSISVRRYADKRLMLNVEGSDLLAAAPSTYYAADAVSELNTFDYVLVNGKSMRENGAIDENPTFGSAKASRYGLLCPNNPEHRAFVYKQIDEMFDYFDGTISREEAIELIKRNSRRYAKRQLTWLRRDTEFAWFHPQEKAKIIEYIDAKVCELK